MSTDQSARTTEQTPNDQPAEISNWDIVNHYFDIAAERLELREDVQAVIRSSYRKLQGHTPAIVTGKPIALEGSFGREAATGRGVIYVLEEVAEQLDIKLDD